MNKNLDKDEYIYVSEYDDEIDLEEEEEEEEELATQEYKDDIFYSEDNTQE